MTPRKKNRLQPPETILPPVVDESADSPEDVDSCSESCPKSDTSRNNDNATC